MNPLLKRVNLVSCEQLILLYKTHCSPVVNINGAHSADKYDIYSQGQLDRPALQTLGATRYYVRWSPLQIMEPHMFT